MLERIKTYGLVTSLIVVSLLYLYIHIQAKIVQKYKDANFILDKQLNVQVDFTNKILTKRKRIDAEGHVKTTRTYIPEEGRIVLKTDKTGKTTVDVKTFGLTFKPGIGVTYENKALVSFNGKIAYWGRYSGCFNINVIGTSIGFSRHIDAMPLLHPRNLELYMGYRVVDFDGRQTRNNWVIGLRTNL